MFDIHVYPLQYPSSDQLPDNFLSSTAPRRAARGREDDQLILLLGYANAQPAIEITQKILKEAAAIYFATSGTATGAMTKAAETVNLSLLRINQKKEGPALLGLLQLAVIRRGMLYVAHCGPLATLVLGNEDVKIFTDADGAGKGLGFSRTALVRFFQAIVESSSLMIFTPTLPPTWTESALAQSPALGMEGLRRRLLNQAAPDLQALVLRLMEGSGQVTAMRWAGLAPMAVPPEETVHARNPSEEKVQPTPEVAEEPAAATERPQEPMAAPDDSQQEPTARPLPQPRPRPEAFRTQTFVRKPAEPAPEQPIPQQTPAGDSEREDPQPFLRRGLMVKPAISNNAKRGIARGWLAFQDWGRRVMTGARNFFFRVLPKGSEPDGTLSAGSMLFIAIAIPILVVAIATTVYFRTGKTEQHTTYLAQAQQFAEQAFATDNPADQRTYLQQSVYWLDKAESYQVTERSQVLRVRVQTRLDELEKITRINYTLAVSDVLPSTINITQMASNDMDLYALDSVTGSVLRFVLTDGAYAYDANFACEPGQYGSVMVGKVVDFVMIPEDNSFKATVMAMDGGGGLMYCIPGEISPMVTSIARPDTGMGVIKGISMSGSRLYMLDPDSNAVWRYRLQQDYAPSEQPVLFFGNQVPDLTNVVDLVGYGDELYLLRSNGKTTHCTYSTLVDVKQTSCDDPAEYGDQREGRDAQVADFPEAVFIGMESTQPPDPSIYFLDSKGAGLYHFSIQLKLQRVLSPKFDNTSFHLNHDATAFTITPTRLVFMAFGNLIYVARIP